MTTEFANNPMGPALQALGRIRTEVKKRIGKEGGNLNERILANLDTVETTLLQIQPLNDMIKTLNQQTEVAVHTMRTLSRLALPAAAIENGDDDSSETKGH